MCTGMMGCGAERRQRRQNRPAVPPAVGVDQNDVNTLVVTKGLTTADYAARIWSVFTSSTTRAQAEHKSRLRYSIQGSNRELSYVIVLRPYCDHSHLRCERPVHSSRATSLPLQKALSVGQLGPFFHPKTSSNPPITSTGRALSSGK